MEPQDLELFNRVAEQYKRSGSIRNTAITMELSRSKVRKILITMGLIESGITQRALSLVRQGKNLQEISDIMRLSSATISAYLPYGKRIENRVVKSNDAVRCEKYRARQVRAANGQVNGIIKNRITSDKGGAGMSKASYKLNLVLEGTDSNEILKKYGKVKKQISRDILVNGDTTLHALHYIIQKCFGWENSHLHHFEVPEDYMASLVGNEEGSFMRWADLCGVLFRFPYDTDEYVLSDIYWDDDYEEGISFKSWLKKKYNPPYVYGGAWELYETSRNLINGFLQEKIVEIGPTFEEYMAGKRGRRKVNLEEATFDEINWYFEDGMKELLERLSIDELFGIGQRVAINLNELKYYYDYGDGWEVRIEIEKTESLTQVVYSPICVAADGLPVLDDVGGVHGYCEFLKGIHSEINDGPYDDPQESREWARNMGWTGRMSKPENVL